MSPMPQTRGTLARNLTRGIRGDLSGRQPGRLCRSCPRRRDVLAAGHSGAAFAGFAGALALWLALAVLAPSPAFSGVISGVLVGQDGRPLSGRQLHFEGRVTGDIYVVETGADGSFSADLPGGDYDLRAEGGAVLVAGIHIGDDAIKLGHVREPNPYSPKRLLEREGIAEAIVKSPAPATANVRVPSQGVFGTSSGILVLPVKPPAAAATPAGAPIPTPAAAPSASVR